MKNYLFQGKRIDNNEWVKGNLLTNGYDYDCEIRICDIYAPDYGAYYIVDPDTVSEITEEYDMKMHKEINKKKLNEEEEDVEFEKALDALPTLDAVPKDWDDPEDDWYEEYYLRNVKHE